MLKRAKKRMEKNCFLLMRREERLKRARKRRRRIPASPILKPVKKMGGAYIRAIFPREKTLDQRAYMKITVKICMALSNRFFKHLKVYQLVSMWTMENVAREKGKIMIELFETPCV